MLPIETVESSQLVLSPNVKIRRNQDGASLLDIEHGMCLGLNPMGVEIWDLIEAKHDVAEIVKCLSQRYSVPLEQVQQDVDEFIESLRKNKLLLHTEQKQPGAWGRFTRTFGNIFSIRKVSRSS